MYACHFHCKLVLDPLLIASLQQFNLFKYLVMVQMNLIAVTPISSGVRFKAL
jgi:hypothetical protein